MLTCSKCSKQFPSYLKVEGKVKRFSGRKYCLECSPWGVHNTRRIHTLAALDHSEKKCPACNLVKKANEFYTRRNRADLSPYCIICTKAQSLDRKKEAKIKAVEYKGGKCIICKYDTYYGALDFHHLDRTEKEFEVSRLLGCNWESLEKELDKCVLLCCRCHAEVEGGITKLPE